MNDIEPGNKLVFLLYSIFPAGVFITSLFLSKEVDERGVDKMEGVWPQLKNIWQNIKKIRHAPLIYYFAIYLFLVAVFKPTFADY